MRETIKKNLCNAIYGLWALVVALFWFAMRVIWSSISKVISEAVGEKTPSPLMLDLPLYSCPVIPGSASCQTDQQQKDHRPLVFSHIGHL